MHLQDTMQRIEMEIQNDDNNLAIFFLDPIDKKADSLIREYYRKIYLTGDFIREYKHIKDCLHFELSHHSIGIQLADYCAGVFNSALKGFSKSSDIFKTKLWQFVRKDSDKNFMGYGVIEVPTNRKVRQYLSEKIENLIF